MEQWMLGFVGGHEHLIYGAILVLACVEGPIFSVLFGVLIHKGFFGFLPVYTALMIGDLLGDSGWYWIGRKFGYRFVARFGHHIGITEEKITRVTEVFHCHRDWILIISKATNGFGFSLVTLITAGIVKIPFRRYLVFNLIGQFIWTGILIAVGYYFSNLYSQIDSWFGRVSLGVVALALIFVFLVYIKTLKNKI